MKPVASGALRHLVVLAAIISVSACTDDRAAQLSEVETIDVPTFDPGPQANQNIANPTLVIPDTFPVSEGDELTLVFAEEFDGPEIDPEVWFFATGDGTEKGLPGGWGNNELQYYLPDSAQIVNGVLQITARRENVGGLNYTSARINTEDRFAFKYGRIEASIKMPSGQGLWPAFWMLSQDSDYECDAAGRPCVWAATGEIDIVEAINLDGTNGNEIFATIHYGGEFPGNRLSSVTYTPSIDVTESFNTYAIEWGPDQIRWYFNGLLYAVQNSNVWSSTALNGGPSAPFDQNFHILLNLAVGGNFPGNPNGTTPFPATMEVDWVRVYSGEDPSGGVATEPNVSAPTPTEDPADVISLFSDAYTDIAGIDYNPNWGQATVFTLAQIAGNQMLKYANLNYQGIDFAGNPQDVSDKGFLHLDVWTADSTALNVYLISPGPAETAYPIPVEPNSWVSVDIPLTEFDGVDLTNLIQLKFDGNGTVFLDNLYFAGEAPIPATEGTVPDVVIVSSDPAVTPDLVPGGFEAFGSGSVIDPDFAGDYSFDNALAVTTGPGYGGGILAQVGLTPFTAGFAAPYDALVFKVKGLVDDTIVIKVEPGGIPFLTVDLTAPPAGATVTNLGDGWTQVELPITLFVDVSAATTMVFETTAGAQAENYTIYLTDIGFIEAAASEGVIPGTVIISADPAVTPDLVPGGYNPFGSGSVIVTDFAGDSSFDNALSVTTGPGYGAGILAQVGITGFAAGFASPYDALVFKVKGLVDDTIVVKVEPGGIPFLTVDLTSPPAGATVTDLGDGWTQVELPITLFVDVSTATQIVFETVAGAQAENYTIYLTDIGFTSAGGGGTAGNIVPDGDFENGTLVDPPWKAFANNGIVEVSDTVANGGTYSAHLLASVPAGGGPASFPVLKVERLEEGNLTGGESVTVSFDAIAVNQQPGAVVFFAQLLTEQSGSGATGEFLIQPPTFLTDSWVTYSFDTTLGPDAGGGVSLEFKADCGGTPGCILDAYIDNVSIVIN